MSVGRVEGVAEIGVVHRLGELDGDVSHVAVEAPGQGAGHGQGDVRDEIGGFLGQGVGIDRDLVEGEDMAADGVVGFAALHPPARLMDQGLQRVAAEDRDRIHRCDRAADGFERSQRDEDLGRGDERRVGNPQVPPIGGSDGLADGGDGQIRQTSGVG